MVDRQGHGECICYKGSLNVTNLNRQEGGLADIEGKQKKKKKNTGSEVDA